MQTTSFPLSSLQRQWKLKTLLLFHLLSAILLGTLFWPVTSPFWHTIDVFFFKMLNGSLEGRKYWQIFWAFANHRNADWVEDVCIFFFFVLHVRSAQKALRPRRVAELIFLVIYAAFLIFFINRVIFKQFIVVGRESPTLIVENSVRLSNELPWLKIKDDSSKSFPGDHGTTALLFAAGFGYFANRKLAIAAALYATFLCLPRMIAGAHWITDIAIGSGSIAMIFLGWAFCTPFASRCIDKIEGFLLKAKSLSKRWRTL